MTGVREPGVHRAGRRQETPHGPGYRLVLVLPDGGEVPAGWAVQGGLDGKRWATFGVDGDVVVSSATRDSLSLSSTLLEHRDRLTRRPEPAATAPSFGQRYDDPVALGRMAVGACPECGGAPSSHGGWGNGRCSLTDNGVADRLAQYRHDHRLIDQAAELEEPPGAAPAAVSAPLLTWERYGDRVDGLFRGVTVVRLFDVNHGIGSMQDLVTSNFDLPMPGPYVAGSGTWRGDGALDKGKAWAEEHLRLWLDRMGLELKGSS